jgi:hypothetical protein
MIDDLPMELPMNATIDRLAVQAAMNPAVLHILNRDRDVLAELRALDTTRAFGTQLEAYIALEDAALDEVLEHIRSAVVEMWALRRPVPARAA